MLKPPLHDPRHLFEHMSTGTLVITPNKRLSRTLLNHYFKNQSSTVIEKPLCLPYADFLKHRFDEACRRRATQKHPLLLSPAQAEHLWTVLLKQASPNPEPVVLELLQEIQEAWRRCQHWQLDIHHPAFNQTPQTRLFKDLAFQFKARLKAEQLITEDQLPDYLLQTPELFQFPSVIWACFNDYSPQQEQIQQLFEANGTIQRTYDLTIPGTHCYQYAASTPQEEEQQLLQWIASRLQAGDTNIGIIVPELETEAPRLKRLMQQTLPETSFNLSLGKPLIHYPIIAHALILLELEPSILQAEQVRCLLCSPYLKGSMSEWPLRMEVMEKNKWLQESEIPFQALRDAWKQEVPELSKCLDAIIPYPEEATPLEWIHCFKSRLFNLGFPGEYPLSSTTYQCLQRLMNLFDECLQWSVIQPIMRRKEALEHFRHLVNTIIFQDKTSGRVEFLGLLEAAGCTFDSIWVRGLTDQCLPQSTRFSAFIPLALQKRYQMPRTSPELMLNIAQKTVQRLQSAASHCIFSYPELIEDQPQLPSPLIHDLPMHTPCKLPHLESSKLETSEECYQIPLTANEHPGGGTTLLANQAKCPFRAFAAHRLHAKRAPTVSFGPSAPERGQTLHRVMENLWRTLGSQHNLLSLSPETLDNCINKAIQEALSPMLIYRRYSFPGLMQSVETTRLKALIQTCLEWEKQRPPFEIAALEETFTITLEQLEFQVRIDRIDRVDKHQWVIDYKTTLPDYKPWNQERPEEPQLLVYALLDEQINTLLWLQLKQGRLTSNGISADTFDEASLKTIKTLPWDNARLTWQKQLTTLAQEIHAGHCAVKPARDSLCRQCDFPALCRIKR